MRKSIYLYKYTVVHSITVGDRGVMVMVVGNGYSN